MHEAFSSVHINILQQLFLLTVIYHVTIQRYWIFLTCEFQRINGLQIQSIVYLQHDQSILIFMSCLVKWGTFLTTLSIFHYLHVNTSRRKNFGYCIDLWSSDFMYWSILFKSATLTNLLFLSLITLRPLIVCSRNRVSVSVTYF